MAVTYRLSALGHVRESSNWNTSKVTVDYFSSKFVAMDLEGIVCKRKDSPYKVTEKPSHYWIKVKNSRYSQLEGREELFERG